MESLLERDSPSVLVITFCFSFFFKFFLSQNPIGENLYPLVFTEIATQYSFDSKQVNKGRELAIRLICRVRIFI